MGMDNVRQLRPVPAAEDRDDQVTGAMVDTAAEAVAIVNDVARQLQALTVDLLFLAACTESHSSAVLMTTIATDLDLIKHGLPTIIADAIPAPKGPS